MVMMDDEAWGYWWAVTDCQRLQRPMGSRDECFARAWVGSHGCVKNQIRGPPSPPPIARATPEQRQVLFPPKFGILVLLSRGGGGGG